MGVAIEILWICQALTLWYRQERLVFQCYNVRIGMSTSDQLYALQTGLAYYCATVTDFQQYSVRTYVCVLCALPTTAKDVISSAVQAT